jgi:hypothetical protein
VLLAEAQGLGEGPWAAATEAIKRHPAGWLFAALCAILCYLALTKFGPVVVQAVKEDRESKRKHELAKLRLKKQIEDRRAQRKEETQ